jgi:O-antigen/teichoic acid export membrane protein
VIKKSLIKISFVGAGNVVNAGLGLFFIAAVARSIGVEDFGRYALITSLLVFLAKVTDFGTNSIFVARSITHSQNLINRFVTLKVLLFAVALPLSLITLYLLDFTGSHLLLIFILGLVAYTFNFALFGLFQRTENYAALIALNTIPATIKGAFALLMVLGIININFSQAFLIFSGSIMPSIFLAFLLPKEMRVFSFSLEGIKEMFRDIFPAGTSQLIGEGWSALSNSIAKIVGGFFDVGIFSIADKIASVFSLVSLSIFTVLLPNNSKLKKESGRYDFKETVLLAGGVFLVSVLGIAMARPLVPVVFGTEYLGSLPLLDLMIIAGAITAIHTFMENYFYVEGRTWSLFQISFSKLGVFLLGSIILIPAYGIRGIALAQLFSALTALLTTVLIILTARRWKKEAVTAAERGQ